MVISSIFTELISDYLYFSLPITIFFIKKQIKGSQGEVGPLDELKQAW